jgi:hypothetical protein
VEALQGAQPKAFRGHQRRASIKAQVWFADHQWVAREPVHHEALGTHTSKHVWLLSPMHPAQSWPTTQLHSTGDELTLVLPKEDGRWPVVGNDGPESADTRGPGASLAACSPQEVLHLASSSASSTTRTSGFAGTNVQAQNEEFLSVSVVSRNSWPMTLLNHWRSLSTRETIAIGTLKILQTCGSASSVALSGKGSKRHGHTASTSLVIVPAW